MELTGNSFVVTGGASGLGLATMRQLMAGGARVVMADLNEPPPDDAQALGGAAAYVRTDVTDEESVQALFDRVRDIHGPLRGVVHCAGRGGDRLRILDKEGNPSPLDIFLDVIRINLVGTYNVLRFGAASLAERAGQRRADRLGGRVRRPDRPDVVHGIQGGRARHHLGRRPGPGQSAYPG
jgi:NAD(P)-dependent dehydrogenase (short-subunit alcohol dehydrogenase family)